ncbi:MAG: TonB-dependent receptor domain-containing protein, partial [Candidatus Cryptobacteroides sp.]
MKKVFTLLLSLFLAAGMSAAPRVFSIAGTVVATDSGEPVAGAAVRLGTDYLWTITDSKGQFHFDKVYQGKYAAEASCLGYVSQTIDIDLTSDIEEMVFSLSPNSLALDGVTVTAQRPKDGLSTSRNIGRDALDHLQMSNMSDIAALLPGGKTVNPDLTTNNILTLRDGGQSVGNAAFGTAVEIDGVRFGNNASLNEPTGVGTRSVAVENIESIEVITGVPSAEYGDLSSGIIKINTKKGRTPVNITFSVNPRTWQVSASKGLDLQEDKGVLNVSGEWARAVKKLSTPYESYTRGNIGLNYSNSFKKVLRLETGISGNIGGMNTKDDPDAYKGEYQKARENVLMANAKLTWLLNKSWITNLQADASVNFVDNLSRYHKYESRSSVQPSVHSVNEGYFLADRLPLTYFSDQVVDSKELDFAASLKYNWHRRWNEVKSSLKAGIQWKANGNAGQGEYYEDPSLAPTGYRPRPYTDYPFMHNLAVYAEEHLTVPVGRTSLELMAGLRLENVFIRNSVYRHKTTLSPRFNLKWNFGENVSLRGGWGVTEKLPSYYVLYPKQEYRDILTFGFSHGDSASYVYYTQPYTMTTNPELKWQKNYNSEIGIDASFCGMKVSLAGFYNITKGAYDYLSV